MLNEEDLEDGFNYDIDEDDLLREDTLMKFNIIKRKNSINAQRLGSFHEFNDYNNGNFMMIDGKNPEF